LLLLLPRNSEGLLFLASIIFADDLSVVFVTVISLCPPLCERAPRACEDMGHANTMNAEAAAANVFRPTKQVIVNPPLRPHKFTKCQVLVKPGIAAAGRPKFPAFKLRD
jgi:hypothetical protein